MKRAIIFLSILVAILIICPRARAEYIDLSQGGTVVGQAQCRHDDGKVYVCVVVDYKNEKYAVLIDQKGEKYIYKFDGKKMVMLWSRGSV